MSSPGQRTMPGTRAAMNGHRGAPTVGSPLSTRHRPTGYAALAVALIVGLGAVGYFFYTQAGAKIPVVIAATDIPAGHTITRSDLSTVEVAGGVTAVAGDHLAEVVGRTAAVPILAHTLVQLAMVTSGSPLSETQALIGVAAAPGQVPSSGLAPGDSVEVLALPQKAAATSSVSSPVLAPVATVYDVRANPAVEGGVLVTLLAAKTAAFGIEAASNSGLIALVKVASP